tara:strand:+ start:228 stop:1592 length:1365 start_codon:yes stop_codon:yes gene_type:complete
MNILLPLETINREIDFKLVLAGYLSGQGHQIYIGQNDALMSLVPHMKNGGIYIGKSMFFQPARREKGKRYHLLKKHNFGIVYLHEEGGVFEGDKKTHIEVLQDHYTFDFFDKDFKDDIDVCVWGNFQKSVDQKRSKKVPIHVTGHPRFDVCKKEWHELYQSKADEIKKKYKKFILINSNFVTNNHGAGLEYLFCNPLIDSEKERQTIVSNFVYCSKQFASMVQLIHNLAIKFPELNFIYRPHPSENMDLSRTVFFGVKNIFVEHEGSAIPWILASQLLLHDNCTTAIEARLAGKPVINYKGHYDKFHDIWLANDMGIQTSDIDEIVFCIQEAINDKLKMPIDIKTEKYSNYLHNITGNSYDEFLKIINNKIDKNKQNDKISYINNQKYFYTYLAKNYLSFIFKPHKTKYINYLDQKFYGFKESDINEKLKIISKILNRKISYKYHNSQLISINQ